MTHTDNDLTLRWIIRRDLPEVLNIESRSFDSPWTEEEFLLCMKQRNCIGVVAESRTKPYSIFGFMVYHLHKARLEILNMAVDPHIRRTGVATAMIERLVDRLSNDRRREITANVRETNLAAQLFLARCGFKGQCIPWRYDNGESAIQFRYLLRREVVGSWQGVNRVRGSNHE